jgi:hypothetical protein
MGAANIIVNACDEKANPDQKATLPRVAIPISCTYRGINGKTSAKPAVESSWTIVRIYKFRRHEGMGVAF